MSLRGYLENMTTSGYGGNSLQDLLRLTNIKPMPKQKSGMINALDEFLSNKDNIINIWKGLIPLEKELMEEYIRSSCQLDSEEIYEVFKNHNKKVEGYNKSYFVDYLEQRSSARLLFINKRIPAPIYNILKQFVKPIEVKINGLEELEDENIEDTKIIRESFEKDFVNVIKLTNNSKLKTTAKGIPTKTVALKLNEVLHNKEIETEDFQISDIRTIEDTNRVYGIYKLLEEAGIIKEQNGILTLTKKSEDFLKLNIVDKCITLLKGYVESSKIYELDRIKKLKIQTDRHPNFKECRQLVIEYIKKCPVDKWVSMEGFLKYIKKNNKGFLTKAVGKIMSYDDYQRYYCYRMQDWYAIEGRFINTIFVEYLSVIGIVDVAVTTNFADDDYGEGLYYPAVNYFRLTPLGAYILGITTEYSLPETQGNSALIIQPNFEIIVSEGSDQHVHIIFFDKFAEKISEDNIVIYKISFKAMVTALDNGISIEEIIDYINKFKHNEIPENVLLTLKNWEAESKRITIRTVTIVETDNPYLLEELKSYKTIKNNMVSELPYVFEINSKEANKVKRDIEKKNHFCNTKI